MKKSIALLLVFMLTMNVLVGCSKKNDGEKDLPPADNQLEENINQDDNTGEKTKFEEQDGLLVYVDTENSPFEDSGLKISINEDKNYVEFVKTDLEGKETVDYFKFDYSTNTMEKYYYVSAMGTAFYYYFDLEASELVKVEDGDHEDNTEGMKEAGRFDGAAEKTKDEVTELENYFKEQYHMTIKEAVSGLL
jgi:ABC-type cobalt transport system substrate-binding protein